MAFFDASKIEMDWELSNYFPAFESPERREFLELWEAEARGLLEFAASLPSLTSASPAAWEAALLRRESLMARFAHYESYVECLASAATGVEAFQAESARVAQMGADLKILDAHLMRALRGAGDAEFEVLASRDSLAGARYALERLREQARLTLPAPEETLAAELAVDGLEAWGRLYDVVSGRLEFGMNWPDYRHERLPIAQRAALMEHPDRRVRRAAFDGGNAAWTRYEDVAAAALNAIAGARLTLNRRRGIGHFLDVAVFQAGISRRCLDALMEAVEANRELPRRILRFKASLLGLERLAWYDLTAPLPVEGSAEMKWEEGRDFALETFRATWPALAEFSREALERKWVEWSARAGKRPGAFCSNSPLLGESRVFLTFRGSLGDVRTLAHELGHAHHGHLLRESRYYAQLYPMTLAECASTFAELLFAEGALASPSLAPEQKALLLDNDLTEAAMYLLNIPVRFEFEKAFYEARAAGEVPPGRLRELMAGTQRRVYGDLLDPEGADPLFWASKLHFYITGITFYNFPYTFGYLLSRGLQAQRRRMGGAAFFPRYEEFLRRAGSGRAHEVVRAVFGRDLETPAFWTEAILSLEEPFAAFEEILPTVMTV